MFALVSTIVLIAAAVIVWAAIWMTMEEYGSKALLILKGAPLQPRTTEFRVRQVRQPRVTGYVRVAAHRHSKRSAA